MAEAIALPLPAEANVEAELIAKCRDLLQQMRSRSSALSTSNELAQYFAAANETLATLVHKHDAITNPAAIEEGEDTTAPVANDDANIQPAPLSRGGIEYAESVSEVNAAGISSEDDDASSLSDQPLSSLKRLSAKYQKSSDVVSNRMIGKPPAGAAVKCEPVTDCDSESKSIAARNNPKLLVKIKTKRRERRRYGCSICCAYVNNSPKLLVLHQLKHTDPALYNARKKRRERRRYGCATCLLSFTTRSKLALHQLRHSDPALYLVQVAELKKKNACDVCSKTFRRPGELRIHAMVAHGAAHADPMLPGSPEKQFWQQQIAELTKKHTCDVCSKRFRRPGQLRRHAMVAHGAANADPVLPGGPEKLLLLQQDVVTSNVCAICGAQFTGDKSKLLSHFRRQHLPKSESAGLLKKEKRRERRRHACATCFVSFNCPSKLALHQLKHSDPALYLVQVAELKKRNTCDVCSKTFRRSGQLRRHAMVAHGAANPDPVLPGGPEKPFEQQQDAVTSNVTKGPGKRRYRCAICSASFIRPAKFVLHQLKHSDPARHSLAIAESRKKNTCDVCGATFRYPCALRDHRIAKHKAADQLPVLPGPPGVPFVLQSDASTPDMRVHQKIRNYACEYCDKSFMDRKDLRSHAVRHTGEKSFYCFVCGRAFGRRKTMLRHVRTVHKVASNADAERLLLLDSIEPESQPPSTSSVKTDITQILNQALAVEPPETVSSSKPAHLVLPLASSSTAGSSAQNLSVVSNHNKSFKDPGGSWQGHHCENRHIAAAVSNLPSVDEFYGQASSVPYDYQYAPALAHFWQNAMN